MTKVIPLLALVFHQIKTIFDVPCCNPACCLMTSYITSYPNSAKDLPSWVFGTKVFSSSNAKRAVVHQLPLRHRAGMEFSRGETVEWFIEDNALRRLEASVPVLNNSVGILPQFEKHRNQCFPAFVRRRQRANPRVEFPALRQRPDGLLERIGRKDRQVTSDVPPVRLKPGDGSPPVFTIHRLNGNVAGFFPMSRRMTRLER
jgi:hypothetical protein